MGELDSLTEAPQGSELVEGGPDRLDRPNDDTNEDSGTGEFSNRPSQHNAQLLHA